MGRPCEPGDDVKGLFNTETDPQVRYSTKGPSM
jgi:hypothetical protein